MIHLLFFVRKENITNYISNGNSTNCRERFLNNYDII